MPAEFEKIFLRLKTILEKNSRGFSSSETKTSFSICGGVGPATLKVWKGEMRKPIMPVAFLKIGKAYVSYHLMGLYTDSSLHDKMSKGLKARMQGKTCFNFKKEDEVLFKELEKFTPLVIKAFKKNGFVV
jgi:hypothetical protein